MCGSCGIQHHMPRDLWGVIWGVLPIWASSNKQTLGVDCGTKREANLQPLLLQLGKKPELLTWANSHRWEIYEVQPSWREIPACNWCYGDGGGALSHRRKGEQWMIAQLPCFSLAALRVLGNPVHDWRTEEIRKEKSLNNIKGKQTLMPVLSNKSTHEHGEYHTCHTGGVLPTGVSSHPGYPEHSAHLLPLCSQLLV